MDKVRSICFNNDESDQVGWKWEPGGVYTASSIYKVMMGGGLTRDEHAGLWKAKVSPTVKIFAFLMLKNRILTHEVMLRRNMTCSLPCVLCGNCPIESAMHIFYLCPYAVHVWFLLGRRTGFNIRILGMDLETTWIRTLNSLRHQGGVWKEQGAPLLLCTLWMVWKTRNARIFSDERMPPQVLMDQIWQEWQMWIKHCWWFWLVGMCWLWCNNNDSCSVI